MRFVGIKLSIGLILSSFSNFRSDTFFSVCFFLLTIGSFFNNIYFFSELGGQCTSAMNPEEILGRLGFFFKFVEPGSVFPEVIVVENSNAVVVVGNYIVSLNGVSLKNLNNSRLQVLLTSALQMERL